MSYLRIVRVAPPIYIDINRKEIYIHLAHRLHSGKSEISNKVLSMCLCSIVCVCVWMCIWKLQSHRPWSATNRLVKCFPARKCQSRKIYLGKSQRQRRQSFNGIHSIWFFFPIYIICIYIYIYVLTYIEKKKRDFTTSILSYFVNAVTYFKTSFSAVIVTYQNALMLWLGLHEIGANEL